MPSSDTPVDVVLTKEIEAIHTRRRVAGFDGYEIDADENKQVTPEPPVETLVGLALSGGGVRSGAFCLGLIQSLYSSGRMRAVDIISSVSGGGYAGALFSAETLEKESVSWERKVDCCKTPSLTDRLSIEQNADGSQPERIKELGLYGRMMGDFLKLLSRHLAGFLVTFIFIASGVIAVAAFLAIIMRLSYERDTLRYLHELKFMTDATIPFFPAFLAFLLWLVSAVVGRVATMMGKTVPTFVKYSYVLLMTALLLGLISFLAIGDVDIQSWTRRFGLPDQIQDKITETVHWLGAIISGIFLTLLLPLFAPKRLLESGATGSNPYRKFVFNATGYALLIGVPLFIYYVLVQENISHHTLGRKNSDLFSEGHIGSANNLYETLRAEQYRSAEKRRINGNLLTVFYEDPANEKSKSSVPVLSSDASKLLKKIEEMNGNEDDVSFVGAWLDFAFCFVTDDYFDRVKVVREHDALKLRLIERINDDCLSDPWLVIDQLKLASEGGEKAKRQAPMLRTPEKWLELIGIVKGDKAKTDRYQASLEAVARLLSSQDQIIDLKYVSTTDSQLVSEDRFERKKALKKWFELCKKKDQFEDEKAATKVSSSGDQVALAPKALRNSKFTLEEATVRDSELINLVEQVRLDNWTLLNATYPKLFRPRDTTFAVVVNGKDQWYRFYILVFSVIAFLVTGMLTDLNRTNLHGVYKDQLASTWLPHSNLELSKLNTCKKGAPLHLIHGTLNRMGTRSDPDIEQKSRFTMSYLYCGCKKVGYRPTQHYGDGKMTVADAIAISGAAVSPVTSPEMLARILLFVTNFRLGQWLLNPKELKNDGYWPSPISTLMNWMRYPEQRKYVFVSDGGHLDNTGLAALLERRCKLMVLADASYDPDYTFIDLNKLLQAARAKYGIRVLDMHGFEPDQEADGENSEAKSSYFSAIRPNEHGISKSHILAIEIQYSENHSVSGGPERGLIIVCKSSLTGDEVPELLERMRMEDEFPHDKTSDQFLAPDRFEAYLEMGRHIGDTLDEFVLEGKVDQYNLPLGWSSGAPTEDAENETADSEVEVQVEEAVDAHAFLAALEESSFNRQTIDAALKHLDSVLESQTLKGSVDSGLKDQAELSVRNFFNWARGNGENARKQARRRLCDGLGKLVQTRFDAIAACPTTHLCFWQTLTFLGDEKSKSVVEILANASHS